MDWVIVEKDRPLSCWDIFKSEDGAMAKCAQLNAERDETYKVMTWDEFQANKRKVMLGDPLQEITEDEWMEALECLPPFNWHSFEGVNRFMMGEFYTETYTMMYARYKDKYYKKMVDATDNSTWITKEMIDESTASIGGSSEAEGKATQEAVQ